MLKAATTGLRIAGGALGASSSARLASPANGQSSNWGANVVATTAVTAQAFKLEVAAAGSPPS